MCARYTLTPEQAKDEPMPVDLPETFNYLIGLHVASRRVYESKGTHYLVYRGKVDSRETVILWRTTRGWKQEQFEADRDFVLRMVRTSMRLHRPTRVWMFAHSDCGAYPGTPVETQTADLQTAAQVLKRAEPTLAVECFFANFDGIYSVG